jgi:uncharacterized protein YcfJ
MKKTIALIAVASAAVGVAHAEAFVDQARVRNAEPQYETVAVPRQECANQLVTETRRTGSRDYGGAILGGIAGALLGNQVGGGHGREAATAVGAVVGAMTGDNLSNRGRYYDTYQQAPREVTTCRTVQDFQQRVTGYRVEYEYRGQVYSTFMPQDPGRTLRVRVSVDPV